MFYKIVTLHIVKYNKLLLIKLCINNFIIKIYFNIVNEYRRE